MKKLLTVIVSLIISLGNISPVAGAESSLISLTPTIGSSYSGVAGSPIKLTATVPPILSARDLHFQITNVSGSSTSTTFTATGSTGDTDLSSSTTTGVSNIYSTSGSVSGLTASLEILASPSSVKAPYAISAWLDANGNHQYDVFEYMSPVRFVTIYTLAEAGLISEFNEPAYGELSLESTIRSIRPDLNWQQLAPRTAVTYQILNSSNATWVDLGTDSSLTVSDDGTYLHSTIVRAPSLGEQYRVKVALNGTVIYVAAQKTAVLQGADITGTLKTADGTAISGTTVTITPNSGTIAKTKTAVTSLSGAFTFANMPRGEYTIVCGRTVAGQQGKLSLRKEISIQDFTAQVYNLKFPNLNSSALSGKVQSQTEVFNDGTPKSLPGVRVNFLNNGIEISEGSGIVTYSASATTDVNGFYTLTGAPVGSINVSVWPDEARYLPLHSQEIVISGSAQAQNFQIMPYPIGTAGLAGTALDVLGSPVAAMNVDLWCSKDGMDFNYQTTTDSFGGYYFGRLPGYSSCSVSFSKSGFLTWYSNSKFENLGLTEGLTKTISPVIVPAGTSTVSGVISSTAAGSAPIANVRVTISTKWPNTFHWSGSAVTDSNGAYTISNVPVSADKPFQLTVETAYTDDDENEITLSYFQPKDSFDLTVTSQGSNLTRAFALDPLPVGTITLDGTLTDRDLDTPIANGLVKLNFWVTSGDKTASVTRTTSTDASGHFVFTGVNSSYGHGISAQASGYSGESFWIYLRDDETSRTRDISLKSSGLTLGLNTVTGIASNGSSPLGGVYVWLQSDTGRYFESEGTNSLGRFVFKQVPSGNYTISATKWGNIANRWTQTYSAERTAIQVGLSGTTTTHDIILSPSATGTGTISGKLVDDRLGTNVSGVGVSIYGLAVQSEGWGVTTGNDGTWSISNLPPGDYAVNYDLWNTPTSYRQISELKVSVSNGQVSALPTSHTSSLAPGAGKLTIQLRDSATKEPLPNLSFGIWATEYQSVNFSATSNSKGLVVFENLPAIDYTGWSWDSKYMLYNYFIRMSGSDQRITAWVEPLKSTGVVSGTVRDTSGNPIANVDVGVGYTITFGCCSGDGQEFTSTTDLNGRFEIRNVWSNKTLYLHARADSRDKVDFAPIRQNIRLSDGQTISGLNLVMYRSAKLSGNFIVGGSSAPALVQVEARDASTDEYVSTVSTDATGKFSLDGLPAKPLVFAVVDNRVPASSQNYAFGYLRQSGSNSVITASRATATEFVLNPGSETKVTNVAVSRGASISGVVSVVTSSGSATLTRSIRVVLHQKSGSSWIREDRIFATWASPGDGGKWTLYGVPDGVYKVEFYDDYFGTTYVDKVFSGQKSTLAAATEITISGGASVANVNATMTYKAPNSTPVKKDLATYTASEKEALKDQVEAVKSGSSLTVKVGKDFAGQWVSLSVESTVVSSSAMRSANLRSASVVSTGSTSTWVQVDANGDVSVSADSAISTGQVVVVQDAENNVIGWTGLSVSSTSSGSGGLSSGGSGGLTGGNGGTTPNAGGTTVTKPLMAAKPMITGTVQTGKTVKATPGKWIAAGTLKVSYTWLSCKSKISASTSSKISTDCVSLRATGSNFKIPASLKGRYLTVRTAATSAGKVSYYVPGSVKIK